MVKRKSSLLDTFLALVQVASPSLRERDVAKILARRLRELGYEPLEDDVGQVIGGNCGNLIVKVPATGAGPNLLLSAHIDTVEKPNDPPALPHIEGKVVRRTGGGILGADDKAGVAVLVELLSRLKTDKRKHGELLFVFSVAEELECLGAAELDKTLYQKLEGGVILDYALPTEIVIAAPTKVSFKITVHGSTGHAAVPERKINALQVLARVVADLPMGRLDAYTTANAGIMRSGNAINIIPGKAYAEYEIRSHRKDILDFHVKQVVGIIEGVVRKSRVFGLAGAGGGLAGAGDKDEIIRASVDVEVEVGYEGFRLAEDAKLVRTVQRAAQKAGLTPELIIAQGGSDANIYNRRGLPSLVVGCGMHEAHGSREYADLGEMQKAVELLDCLVHR
ncbi:MAG: M20/M25/M40 family metallo-hydrolase [Planctomycetota bacterium]|jgi:tripeptide aminopeptidase|nr:M20/M25/M40 family metallo-hydrolase [Planctomycetota bacterium]